MSEALDPVNSTYMKMALKLAESAAANGEVPVGAVLVLERTAEGVKLDTPQVIAGAANNRESAKNAVGHAELIAIEEGCRKLGRWRLTGCTLYVTLEPCLMCSGAIVLARVDKVVYGARDPKAGAVESLYQTLADIRLNHRPQVVAGVCESECSEILKKFFGAKRQGK